MTSKCPPRGTSGRYVDEPDLWTIDRPFFVAGQEKVPPRTAPAVGENSEEVLRAAGVIGQFPDGDRNVP